MRYLKHYFESIAGIEIFPIISLLLFFLFFVGLLIYVMRLRKEDTRRMSMAPLEFDEQDDRNPILQPK